mgnify:CR=1 FL=1
MTNNVYDVYFIPQEYLYTAKNPELHITWMQVLSSSEKRKRYDKENKFS